MLTFICTNVSGTVFAVRLWNDQAFNVKKKVINDSSLFWKINRSSILIALRMIFLINFSGYMQVIVLRKGNQHVLVLYNLYAH